MTELFSEGMEGMAPLHRSRPCAVPKDSSSSGALPDPEAVRGVISSPLSVPDLPFLCQRSPSWCGVSQSRGGFISHQACQLVRRKLVSSPGCKAQWKDVNQFPYCHISPEAMESGDVLFLRPCLLPSTSLPSTSLPRAQGLQWPASLQKQLINHPPLPLLQLWLCSTSALINNFSLSRPVQKETDTRNKVCWKWTEYGLCCPQGEKEFWSNIFGHIFS